MTDLNKAVFLILLDSAAAFERADHTIFLLFCLEQNVGLKGSQTSL